MIRRIFASVLAVLVALPVLLAQGPVVITGRVISTDDEPLPGATVSVVGTKDATATDVDGNFTLRVPATATDKRYRPHT